MKSVIKTASTHSAISNKQKTTPEDFFPEQFSLTYIKLNISSLCFSDARVLLDRKTTVFSICNNF